jgi:hypothetical protein
MSRIELPIPSYTAIRNGDNHATEDAIRGIVKFLQDELTAVHKSLNKATNSFNKAVYALAPTANTNNLNYMKTGVLHFTGGTAVNLTGIIAPEIEGAVLILHTTGAGTITAKHQDGNSDAQNRIVSASAADRAISTGKTLILCYLADRWRDISFQ